MNAGLSWSEIKEDQNIPDLRMTVSKLRMMMYAAATWNPYRLHWDSEYCKDNGFPEANIAGPMFGAYLTEMLTRWAGVLQVKSLEYRNRGMGFPGDTLICKGKVLRKYEEGKERLADCQVWVENQTGSILVEGSAVVGLP